MIKTDIYSELLQVRLSTLERVLSSQQELITEKPSQPAAVASKHKDTKLWSTGGIALVAIMAVALGWRLAQSRMVSFDLIH